MLDFVSVAMFAIKNQRSGIMREANIISVSDIICRKANIIEKRRFFGIVFFLGTPCENRTHN